MLQKRGCFWVSEFIELMMPEAGLTAVCGAGRAAEAPRSSPWALLGKVLCSCSCFKLGHCCLLSPSRNPQALPLLVLNCYPMTEGDPQLEAGGSNLPCCCHLGAGEKGKRRRAPQESLNWGWGMTENNIGKQRAEEEVDHRSVHCTCSAVACRCDLSIDTQVFRVQILGHSCLQWEEEEWVDKQPKLVAVQSAIWSQYLLQAPSKWGCTDCSAQAASPMVGVVEPSSSVPGWLQRMLLALSSSSFRGGTSTPALIEKTNLSPAFLCPTRNATKFIWSEC